MTRRGLRFGYVLVGAGMVVAGVAIAVVLLIRVKTGAWRMPTGDDLVWIAKRMPERREVPRVIYLNRGPTTLTAGADASHLDRSSVLASTGRDRATVPAFRSSDKRRWGAIVSCIRRQFAPFGVEVTEQRPTRPGYIMVVIGGKPADIGYHGHHVGGLAPFNGEVVPDAVVFGFAAALGNRTRAVCETVAMEVAHAYGLDHSYHCKDVMTYRSGCGKKSFVDRDVPCGEKKARACASGAPTQNSYRRLLELLGPGAPPPSKKQR